MCCISQILMAISYTDFPKSLYFKCTMNLKLDHHTYKVNFSKKILLVGLSSKNIFWMTRKKNPAIKNDDFLTFYWQTLVHFDCYTAMNWPWLSKVPWIFQNPESMRLQKNFPGPVDSNFEIKMLFLSFESKKLLNEVITSRENGLKLSQNWCRLGKNLNFSMFEACMYK